MWDQIPSLVGAAIVLTAFTLVKLRRISAHSHAFDVLNLAGCAVLLVAAIIDRRYGFILLNVVWAFVSLYYIISRLRNGRSTRNSV